MSLSLSVLDDAVSGADKDATKDAAKKARKKEVERNVHSVWCTSKDFRVAVAMPGWLLTAFAISLGAPFWFDLVKKIVSIRASGKAPGEKPRRKDRPMAGRRSTSSAMSRHARVVDGRVFRAVSMREFLRIVPGVKQ